MKQDRLQLLIKGLVQGVGFRPFVYRLAQALSLTGWVKNTGEGVLLEIQGLALDVFLKRLLKESPPLARIDSLNQKSMDIILDEAQFNILKTNESHPNTLISPDVCLCKDCLEELFDKSSRYHEYPFINCTHCGPRFTITYQLPYDRKQTALADFKLCSLCQQAYNDPLNRRYHAQPMACNECGPHYSESILGMAEQLKQGKILAIKGLGGYQLICDAWNEKSIATLRFRKGRERKPFALMVLNMASVKQIAKVSLSEAALLESPVRPIVLLTKKNHRLPECIAPHLSKMGVMLAYTPFHFLLFDAMQQNQANPVCLVVTSANVSGQPLLIEDEAAQVGLGGIADQVISYNRPIAARADDSVMQVINQRPAFIRRARGFVPERIQLPFAIPETLALGAHQKNTCCFTRGDEAFVTQHIGSLTNRETISYLHETIDHWQRLLGVKVKQIACDWHPDFYTTRFAETFNLPIISVQHHHAHLASVAAEHQLSGQMLGLALDGYGMGYDGAAWGGELMLLDGGQFTHLGNLMPLKMPGGEIAAREPWRMAYSVLHALGQEDKSSVLFPLMNLPLTPMTHSLGRVFDAASALLGICSESSYEGEAAMRLESWVTQLEILPEGFQFNEKCFSILPLLGHLPRLSPSQGANLFHGTLIHGLTEWLCDWTRKTGIQTILLSGGCLSNQILAEGLIQRLTNHGLLVYLPEKLPPNDGGLSLGQAWIAGLTSISNKEPYVFSHSSQSHPMPA